MWFPLKAYAFAAKIDGLENDLVSRKRRSGASQDQDGKKNRKSWGLPEKLPAAMKPEVPDDIMNQEKAASNIKSANAGEAANITMVSRTTIIAYYIDHVTPKPRFIFRFDNSLHVFLGKV